MFIFFEGVYEVVVDLFCIFDCKWFGLVLLDWLYLMVIFVLGVL